MIRILESYCKNFAKLELEFCEIIRYFTKLLLKSYEIIIRILAGYY